MDNRYFTTEMLEIIAEPERWLLVGSSFAPDIQPVNHPRHAAWMLSNSHTHAHHEIMIVLSGEGRHGYGGQIYPIKPGTVFFFKAFESHDASVPAWTTEGVQLWIALTTSEAIISYCVIQEGTFTPRQHWHLILSRDQIGSSDQAFLAGGASLILPPVMYRLHLRSFLGICLCMAVHAGFDPESSHAVSTVQQQIIQAMQHHIEETAGRGVTVESLASLAGYSKYHLLRLFKQNTGHSVHEYINMCRISRTHEMLATGHSQKEIAATLGFSSPSAFLHWYKIYRQG